MTKIITCDWSLIIFRILHSVDKILSTTKHSVSESIIVVNLEFNAKTIQPLTNQALVVTRHCRTRSLDVNIFYYSRHFSFIYPPLTVQPCGRFFATLFLMLQSGWNSHRSMGIVWFLLVSSERGLTVSWRKCQISQGFRQ